MNVIAIAAVFSIWQGPQGPREAFEEKIPGTLVSFKMAPIPDGRITVNGNAQEIKGIWMGTTEVTWDLYDIFAFKLDIPEEERPNIGSRARPTRPYGAPDRGFGHAGYPAIGMTYDGARIFCTWLSEKTGKKYRLPTEAEWEYAARAGMSGNSPGDLAKSAWFWDNAEDATHPVGKLSPNAWGIHDMLGNVGEWASGPEKSRLLCGGTFLDKAADIRFGARKKQEDSWQQSDPQMPKSKWWLTDAPFVGFRVVCEG
jgi:formylglycine-generating enzyme required for sulfatase activity